MRRTQARRLLPQRRPLPAAVRIVDVPEASWTAPDGSVTTLQAAEVMLSPEQLDRLWTPENLENLARTYWAYLEKISLGLLRIRYTPDAREIVLLRRPLVLIRFHKPDYELEANRGLVTWRIERGLLVWPWGGRDKGFLRLCIRRRLEKGRAILRIQSEVAHFYPTLALPGLGLLSRIGRGLYRITQLRVHVLVTHGFLRSLASLELEESRVGALRLPAPELVP